MARVGAHSFRIVGATDLADIRTHHHSCYRQSADGRRIRYRAHLRSDDAAGAQLAASRLMQSRGARDMEELHYKHTSLV